MKRSMVFCALMAGVVLSWGLTGCDSEADMEKGAIVEGTKLVGWGETNGKIKIPDGVTIIGNGALSRREEITSVVIPNSVLVIEQWAFRNCTSLTSITIPDSVISIDGLAFWRCDSLVSVSATGEWEEYWRTIGQVDSVGKLTAALLTKGGLDSYFRRVTK